MDHKWRLLDSFLSSCTPWGDLNRLSKRVLENKRRWNSASDCFRSPWKSLKRFPVATRLIYGEMYDFSLKLFNIWEKSSDVAIQMKPPSAELSNSSTQMLLFYPPKIWNICDIFHFGCLWEFNTFKSPAPRIPIRFSEKMYENAGKSNKTIGLKHALKRNVWNFFSFKCSFEMGIMWAVPDLLLQR